MWFGYQPREVSGESGGLPVWRIGGFTRLTREFQLHLNNQFPVSLCTLCSNVTSDLPLTCIVVDGLSQMASWMICMSRMAQKMSFTVIKNNLPDVFFLPSLTSPVLPSYPLLLLNASAFALHPHPSLSLSHSVALISLKTIHGVCCEQCSDYC